MTSTLTYYLTQLLPLVLLFAALAFLLGLVVGWISWNSVAPQLDAIGYENATLRKEIKRLQA